MAYYRVCPFCLANLDPNEKCDCRKESEKQQSFFAKYLKMDLETGQYSFIFENQEADYAKESAG